MSVAARAALALVLLAAPQQAWAYKLNGFKWDKSHMPVPYYINEAGSKHLGAETFTIVQQSMATWSKVPCSYFRFKYMGKTSKLPGAMDKTQVIGWEEKKWVFGPYAAAATSYGGVGDLAHGDIAFNGVNFTWKKGGGSIFEHLVVDPQAVITHEAGHLLGLSHTEQDLVATMAAAYTAGATQRTLAVDDKLGLCELYPADAPKNECNSDCDCPPEAECKYFSKVKISLCAEYRHPVNGPCTERSINCPDQCLYYYLDTTKKVARGLCTTACTKEGDACANSWTCKKVTTNYGQGKLACAPAKPKPDPAPKHPRTCKPDAGPADGAAADPDAGDGDGADEGGSSCAVDQRASSLPVGGWLLLAMLLLLARRGRRRR